MSKLEAVNLGLFDIAVFLVMIGGVFVVMAWALGKVYSALGYQKAVLDYFWYRKKFHAWMLAGRHNRPRPIPSSVDESKEGKGKA